MTYKVIIAPEAIDDMQRHYDYIAYEKQSIINAEAQISRIKEEIIKLDTLPNGHRALDYRRTSRPGFGQTSYE